MQNNTSNFQIRVRINDVEGWMDADTFFYYFKNNREFYDKIPEFVPNPVEQEHASTDKLHQ